MCVCVCVCREYISGTEIFCADPLWPWSSSGSSALCYVLPVLWMMSLLAVMGHMAMRYRGGVWCLWMPCFTCNHIIIWL